MNVLRFTAGVLFALVCLNFSYAVELRLDCQAVLLEADWDKPSLSITEGRARVSNQVLGNWWRWSANQFKRLAREHRMFENRASQEVLLLEHYSVAEQKFISELLVMSQSRERVEVGGWRIMLKDGRVLMSALTSHQKDQIADNDAWPVFEKTLTDAKVTAEDIAIVQFFHTHAETPLLSGGDGHYVEILRHRLRELKSNAPVHIYAILPVEGETITSHRSIK